MSKQKKYAGETSVSLAVFIQDTSSTTGGGLSGVTSASSGLVMEYRRQGQSTWTSVTPAPGKVLGTFLSNGIVADGALAGAYEVDFPDAAFASGVKFVLCRIRGVTNMLPCLIEVELDAVNYQDSAGFGLSRLNAPVGSIPTNPLLTTDTRLNNLNAPIGSIPTNPLLTTDTRLNNLNSPIGSIPTNPLLTTDIRLNNLNAPIGSIPTNPLLTTDSRLNYLNASIAAIPTNPLLTTDARLNFLDASIATSTNSILGAITGLNNLSAKSNLFGAAVLEAPETGSSVYEFTLVVNDDEGKLVNLDAAPTVTATNSTGTDRSTNLSAVTNPSVGRYRFTYTVASIHARESLRIEANGTTSTEARYAIWAGAVVDYDVTTILTQISSDLSLKPTLAQIEGSTVLAKVNTPLIVGQINSNVITAASIAAGALNGKGDWALALYWNQVRAGYLDGVILADNYNTRIVKVTGAKHVASDIHESQVDSMHPTSFESTVYDTISADLLGTVHTGYVTPGTVGKTLNDTNTSLSALLTRVPVVLAQLATDLAIMLVGSGTSLVRWTVNALSLAPSGGGGGTVIATVTVPAVLQNTAFALDELLVYRGTYWSFQIQNLGDLTPYSQIWFCLRKRQSDDESQSDLLIALNGGLIIANKKAATDPLLASLTVSGSNITIQVDESVTQFIDTGNNYNYDLKGVNVAGRTIMLHESDKFIVKRDVTRRIS